MTQSVLDGPFRFGGFCPLRYDLPADIRLPLPSDSGQLALDRYSWKTFLALSAPAAGKRVSRHGDNPTQWDRWSSTVDLIQCNSDADGCVCPDGGCSVSGARYYPPECEAVEGFEKYRVLDQISKVDDSFIESEQGAGGTPRGGLGNSPLVDAHGNFVRYEILISPVAYDYVVANRLYEESGQADHVGRIMFPCGEASYTGGDPADPRIGAYIVKNAWMEMPENSADGSEKAGQRQHWADGVHGKLDHRGRGRRSDYHTEKLLVYTPSYRNSTGVASCELKSMALVGQHTMHKTTRQPRWIWSTFEHRMTAPDCTELPPPGDMMGTGPSKACPASVSRRYDFYPEACSADGSDPDACQACNEAVDSNFPGCINPNVPSSTSFCLDQPPAMVAGTSKTCRQVPIAQYYPTAHRLNQSCARRLGKRSVWSNYELISTMWYNEDSDRCRTVQNIQLTFRIIQRPHVPIDGEAPPGPRPFVANTTMETDVRSDCMGCHSAAAVGGVQPPPGTDFNFWLQLEVGGGGRQP